MPNGAVCNHCASCADGFTLVEKNNGDKFCEAKTGTTCDTCGFQDPNANGVIKASCCGPNDKAPGVPATWVLNNKSCGSKQDQKEGLVDYSYGEGRKACANANGRRL